MMRRMVRYSKRKPHRSAVVLVLSAAFDGHHHQSEAVARVYTPGSTSASSRSLDRVDRPHSGPDPVAVPDPAPSHAGPGPNPPQSLKLPIPVAAPVQIPEYHRPEYHRNERLRPKRISAQLQPIIGYCNPPQLSRRDSTGRRSTDEKQHKTDPDGTMDAWLKGRCKH